MRIVRVTFFPDLTILPTEWQAYSTTGRSARKAAAERLGLSSDEIAPVVFSGAHAERDADAFMRSLGKGEISPGTEDYRLRVALGRGPAWETGFHRPYVDETASVRDYILGSCERELVMGEEVRRARRFIECLKEG